MLILLFGDNTNITQSGIYTDSLLTSMVINLTVANLTINNTLYNYDTATVLIVIIGTVPCGRSSDST